MNSIVKIAKSSFKMANENLFKKARYNNVRTDFYVYMPECLVTLLTGKPLVFDINKLFIKEASFEENNPSLLDGNRLYIRCRGRILDDLIGDYQVIEDNEIFYLEKLA